MGFVALHKGRKEERNSVRGAVYLCSHSLAQALEKSVLKLFPVRGVRMKFVVLPYW